MSVLTNEYVRGLREAIHRPGVKDYVLSSLTTTLGEIAIANEATEEICQLILGLTHPTVTTQMWRHRFRQLTQRWRKHFERVYTFGYEPYRRSFFQNYVFPSIRGFGPRRCLDLGCGRGWVALWMMEEGLCSEVVGVDEQSFSSDWRDIRTAARAIDFCQLDSDQLDDFLSDQQAPFDLILISWVFHHASTEEIKHVLRAIKQFCPGAIIVVVEDSYCCELPPLSDPHQFCTRWDGLVRTASRYDLSSGWAAQTVLDCVAVQVLARYRSVQMPCNYRLASAWLALFGEHDLHMHQQTFVGFPEFRDIAVPQTVFTMTL